MKDLYFSHDRNAMSDNRISELRAVYHMEGYGVYWGVIEALSREPDLKLSMDERKIKALEEFMRPSFDMKGFIDACVEIGLFKSNGESFWSESLCRRMKEATERAEISRKRSEAAKQRWKASPGTDKRAGKEAAPATPLEKAGESLIDPQWRRVVEAYEREIGMMPTGTAIDTLVSYYEDLGADAVITAIKRTNEAQPGSPFKFLKAILDSFVSKGVRTGQEAEACCLDFDRRKTQRASQSFAQRPGPPGDDDDIRWLD